MFQVFEREAIRCRLFLHSKIKLEKRKIQKDKVVPQIAVLALFHTCLKEQTIFLEISCFWQLPLQNLVALTHCLQSHLRSIDPGESLHHQIFDHRFSFPQQTAV